MPKRLVDLTDHELQTFVARWIEEYECPSDILIKRQPERDCVEATIFDSKPIHTYDGICEMSYFIELYGDGSMHSDNIDLDAEDYAAWDNFLREHNVGTL